MYFDSIIWNQINIIRLNVALSPYLFWFKLWIVYYINHRYVVTTILTLLLLAIIDPFISSKEFTPFLSSFSQHSLRARFMSQEKHTNKTHWRHKHLYFTLYLSFYSYCMRIISNFYSFSDNTSNYFPAVAPCITFTSR